MALTPRQNKAILALLEAPTLKEAAANAKVGVATLRRWLRTPEFSKEYAAVRRETTRLTAVRLQQLNAVAVDSLWAILVDPRTPPGVRVSASRTVLEFSLRATEQLDILERIDFLERNLEKVLR